MDDLKRYLREAAKHSFWIITGLVLLLASIVFYVTKSGLDSSIQTRITTLESSFNKINDVSNKAATHPNDFSHKEMDKRLSGLKDDVDRAWEFQYDRQKEFLTWPTESFFQPRTHEIFDSLRPFEKKVPFPLPDKVPPPLDLITENDRKVYRTYIAPEFPALAQRIGSTWKYVLSDKSTAMAGGVAPPPGSGSFTPPGMGAAAAIADSRDLVRWSEDSQKKLVEAVLPWFARPSPPTIHEIYYAQEDIWILRGLMDIIAQTNAGANENFQAIVKEIEWIRTGAKVSRDAGSLWPMGAATGQGGGAGGPYGGGGGPPMGYTGGGGGGMPSGYGASGGMGGKGGAVEGAVKAAMKVDPADGRYVDTNFKPLTGAQLRAAMNLANATDAVNAVAKRIPVRMRLKVDDRFGRLVTECGNGKMMLEVLQIRYNTDPAAEAAGGAASGGGLTGGGSKPSLGGVGSGAGMMSEDPGSGGGGATSASVDIGTGEVSIEVFGVIYLFNPPASLSSTNAAVTVPAAATATTNSTAPATATVPAPGAAPASGAVPATGTATGVGPVVPAPISGETAPVPAGNPAEPTPASEEGEATAPPEAPTADGENGVATPTETAGEQPPVTPPADTDGGVPPPAPPAEDSGTGSGSGASGNR